MARRCDNCGREGVLRHVADVVLDARSTEVTHGEGHREEAADQRVLLVERCEVCGAPTISTYRYIDGWSDPSDFLDLQQIFPMRRLSDDLPRRVGKRHQKMLQIQAEPDAFAVRAGRLLEAICSDQGVAEGDLGPRLDQLAGKKRQTIPRALADQAHLVRKFRNVGGHDDDVEVEEADVPLIRGLVESLLDFLYWGPANLKRGSHALERRISGAEGQSSTKPG